MAASILRVSLAATLAGVMAATAVASPTRDASAEATAGRLLAAHNGERGRVGVPHLRWSHRLAGEAQDWADQLAKTKAFRHASERSGAGENLWRGTARRYSAEDMVGTFLAEARDFRPGAFPHVSRTGQWKDVGHYSQLIWRGTQEVGCGVASSGRHDILVCRYHPAGNVLGAQVL